MKMMSRLVGHKVPQQPVNQQSQIPNQIHDLVTDEFIRKTQVFIQDPMFGQHNGILQGSSESQVPGPHQFNFMQKTKSSRRSQIADETIPRNPNRLFLLPQPGMIETNGV